MGRCTEDMTADDLRSYFSKFGEVLDVFIPKPFRAFGFVTFADPEIAQNLCGEDHIINNASVHVSSAAPKSFEKPGDRGKGMGGGSYSQFGNSGNSGSGGWGNQGNRINTGGGGMTGGNNPGGMNPNMPNNMGGGNNPLGNMGLNNLSAAFQLNPAMVAAASAALSQGPWGLLGMAGQQSGGNQGGGDGMNKGNQGQGNQGGYSFSNTPSRDNTNNQTGGGFLGSSGWSSGGGGQGDGNNHSQGWGNSSSTPTSGGWN